jgi:hypothetical protein
MTERKKKEAVWGEFTKLGCKQARRRELRGELFTCH